MNKNILLKGKLSIGSVLKKLFLRNGGVAQEVEHLPDKLEVLNSIS
jgi:hypothetical protein